MAKAVVWIAGFVVIVPMLLTVYFYIGGLELASEGTTSDADIRWTPPDVADDDNAFIAVLAATNHIKLATNSWGGADMEFITRYSNFSDPMSRLVREEPGAAEKADRILADNAAFFKAFSEGLGRKGFRNNLPVIEELGYSFLPVSLFGRMARLWRFKIQRKAERGEWEEALRSVEVLHRFGRLVSDNAANLVELLVGQSIEQITFQSICDLVLQGRLRGDALDRLSALLDEDEKTAAGNTSRAIRAEYTIIRTTVSSLSRERLLAHYGYGIVIFDRISGIAADVLGVGRVRSFADRLAGFSIRTLLNWPGYFRYALHRRTTLNRLADVARLAVKGEIDKAACEDISQGLLSRDAYGRAIVHVFAVACENIMSKERNRMAFVRSRARLVLAAARWGRSHGGGLPPKLDALVPQYLEAVPLDPYGGGRSSLGYDAESGVVWSVGKEGRFNYATLKNAKPSVLVRAKSDIMCYAFRLDGKRLDLFDKPANERK